MKIIRSIMAALSCVVLSVGFLALSSCKSKEHHYKKEHHQKKDNHKRKGERKGGKKIKREHKSKKRDMKKNAQNADMAAK